MGALSPAAARGVDGHRGKCCVGHPGAAPATTDAVCAGVVASTDADDVCQSSGLSVMRCDRTGRATARSWAGRQCKEPSGTHKRE